MKERSLPSPAQGRDNMEFIALEQQPQLSGRSADPGVGEFSGRAFARQETPDGRTRYLVLDRRASACSYASVPADANGRAAAELSGQSQAIARACEERGIELVRLVQDVEGGRAEGPGMRHALEQIAAGDLMHDRCELGASRWPGFGSRHSRLLVRERDGRRLVAADLDLHTQSKTGKVAARALAAAGQL